MLTKQFTRSARATAGWLRSKGVILALGGGLVAVGLLTWGPAVEDTAHRTEAVIEPPQAANTTAAARSLERPVDPMAAVPSSAPRDAAHWDNPVTEPAFAAFQRWVRQFRALPETEKAAALPQGIALAQQRRHALKAMIRTDPERALALTVPAADRRDLPLEITTLLEHRVDARGDLDVLGVGPGDGAQRGPAVLRYAAVNGQKYRAYVFGMREYQPASTNIALHGIAVDNVMAVDQWPGRVLEPVEAEEARAALTAEPICEISQQPTASTGQEVALNLGGEVEFFCGPAHANRVLQEAAVRDGLFPPGLGNRTAPENVAASGEKGITMPSFTSMGDAEWTTGGKRIAVVRVSFDGDNYAGLLPADCEKIVNQMSDELRRWSYGKYWLRPVGAGSFVSTVFDLPSRASSYDDDDIGDIWGRTLLWLATNYRFFEFDLLMVIAGNAPIQDSEDGGPVWWGGLGRIGEGMTFLRVGGANVDERIAANVRVGLHELGHNLGLFHASNLFPAPQFEGGLPKTFLEYGDRFDRMGWGLAQDDFNVRYKQWLRWLSPSEVPTAVSDGRYAIRPHNLGEGWGVRGLKVPFGAQGIFNDALYVEYRGGWSHYAPMNYGVTVRLGLHGSAKTYLLDATPETPNHEPDGDESGNWDSPLLPGRTYSHTRNGRTVHITNVETRPGEGAWIEVVQGTPAGNRAPTGNLTANTSVLEYGQTSYLVANVTDPDGDDLAYHWMIPNPASGETEGPYPNQRVLPFAFYRTGNRQVICIVSDMRGGIRNLTNTFTVAVNNPPTISSIPDHSTNEDTPLTTATFTVSDRSRPASSIQVTATSDNPTLLPNANITVNHLGGGNRSLTLTPALNRHGRVVIAVDASDGLKSSRRTFVLTVHPVTPGQVYVSRGSTWRYRDTVTAPPADWAAASFNDTTWSSGTARFVFNQGVLLPGQTPLRNETNRITTYYRRTFTLPADRPGTPTLKLLCDDGAVVYINGVEVWRQNMPTGPIGHTRRALVAVEGDDEREFSIIPLPPAVFRTGSNVLAISVHDVANAREGFDVAFDAELAFLQSPTITGPSVLSTPEDTVCVANFSAADRESPSGGVVMSASSADQTLVADTNIKFAINPFTLQRTVSILPMPNAHGTTTITLRASDGSSETWLPIQFTVTPVNDPPTIAPLPPVAVAYGEVPPLITVELDDTDSPLDRLTLTPLSSSPLVPSGGMEVLPGATPGQRWLRITPNPAQTSGQSTITLIASDGQLRVTNSFVFRITLPTVPNAHPTLLVRSGESWRYYAGNLPLDSRGRPLDWLNPDLDDRTWPQGGSPLGYNYTGLGTTVPVQPYRVTTYFRRSFYLPSTNGLSQLTLRLRRDDGAAVYLNRRLIARQNLPTPFTENTLTSSAVGTASWETLTSSEISALRPGWNVVAVEVHQSAIPTATSPGDLVMDLELDAVIAPAAAVDSLIAAGDQWDYWDSSSYPDATWKTPTFVPHNWNSGLGRFGFGLGGETTLLNGGPGNNRHPSILFRRAFDVGDPSVYRSLHLYLLADDGVQVFLNGSRVFYRNVAPSANESSFALSEVPTGEKLVWRHYLLDPARLHPGRNLLAVSLHQSSKTNANLAFDLQLTAGMHDVQPELFLRSLENRIELSWSAAFNGWQLESSSALGFEGWTPVTQPVLRDGAWHYVQSPLTGPVRFYRLRKP